jgi:hypothetical protein
MKTYYVTNENGDWWTMTSDSKLHIIAMDDPKLEPACEKLDIELEGDKFQCVIWNAGEAVSLIEEGN